MRNQILKLETTITELKILMEEFRSKLDQTKEKIQ